MKILTPILLASMGIMSTARADSAGHNKDAHAHKAPHGGVVNTVGKYHVELVTTDNELRIYVLDKAEKVLSPADRDPKLVLQIPKQPKQKPKLAVKDDYLVTPVDLKGVDSFVAILKLELDGASKSTRFSWKRPKSDHHGGGHHEEGEHHEEGGHH